MTDGFVKDLRDRFLGKRITIPYTGPYQKHPDETVTGLCQFIGPNPNFPSWGLQVTLDRTPFTNIDHTKIKLAE